MSDYLSKASKSKIKPPMITLVGFPGSGKSTLAALFPKPIFIQAEDAGTVFETWPEDKQPTLIRQLPEPNAERNISVVETIFKQLQEIYEEDHDFQTLVIDTVSVLNYGMECEIVEFEGGKKSIQDCCGGFQKAYDRTSEWHKKLITKCMKIRAKRNMSIVFLCHSDELRKKDSPDVADQYTVYAMKMHKKCRDVYTPESDAVIYIKQHQTVIGAETDKKGKQTKTGRIKKSSDRVLITSSDGVVGFVDAKSKYNMPTEIEWRLDDPYKPWESVNPLLEYIPYFNGGGVKVEVEETETESEINNTQE